MKFYVIWREDEVLTVFSDIDVAADYMVKLLYQYPGVAFRLEHCSVWSILFLLFRDIWYRKEIKEG